MKLKKMNWARAIAMGTVSVGFVQALSAATTFTFEGLDHNKLIPGTFGAHVSADATGYTVSSGADGTVGTPDITIDW